MTSLKSLCRVSERHTERLQTGERCFEVERVRVLIDAAELKHLLALQLQLEVLGRLLRHATVEVELVDATLAVPHRRHVVHEHVAVLEKRATS